MQPRHTSRAALAAIVLAVLGLLLAGLTSPVEAASTGRVKGVVTLEGKPVKNAKVQLYIHPLDEFHDGHYEVGRFKTVSTDSKGRYSIRGVKAGTWRGGPKYRYIVLVTDRTGRGAKTLRVYTTKKAHTKTLDVDMKRAVIITGSISRSDGGSPGELTVTMSSIEDREDSGPSNEEFRDDSTTAIRSDGTFTVKGQAAGYYRLIVQGDAYLAQCYDFETNTLEECFNRRGVDVILKAGERRVLAPVVATKVAPAVSRLSGKVTDSSGRPLKGLNISFWSDSGIDVSDTVVTRSSGRFTYRGRLPEGSYRVRYSDPKRIWGLGAGSVGSTSHITITPGRTVRGINARLRSIATSKVATNPGTGRAKVAFRITRKATGSAPSGTLTLVAPRAGSSRQDVTKTVTVKKGRATITLTGLRPGHRSLIATYSGTSTTAGFTKTVGVTVK